MTKRPSNGQGTLSSEARMAHGLRLGSITQANGERNPRGTDRRAAERILAKHVADAALRRERVIDPKLDEMRDAGARSLEVHLADYEAHLHAAHRDAKHVRTTLRCIRELAAAAGWQTAGDIQADGANHYATKLKTDGASARKVQAHLQAAKSFTRWLVSADKLPRDPLASVVKPNPKSPDGLPTPTADVTFGRMAVAAFRDCGWPRTDGDAGPRTLLALWCGDPDRLEIW